MLSPRSRGKGKRRAPVPTRAGRTHATEWHKRRSKRLAQWVEPERTGDHPTIFQYGDVVRVTEEYGNECYVITGVSPHKPRFPYSATKLREFKSCGDGPPVGEAADKVRYGLNDEQIHECIFKIPEDRVFWYEIRSTKVHPLRKAKE